MRTTVTLDPDVAALLKERMRERDLGFKEALNQALRTGLTGDRPRRTQAYELKTFNMGFSPDVSLDDALALAAEDEDREILRKLSLRK